MFKQLKAILQNEQGQGLVEYGLILGLVAVVCITATKTLGTKASSSLTTSGNALP